MTPLSRAMFLALVAAATAIAQTDAPWALPREMSAFQFLLDRSPFSLPTAEESSPLADRFSLTGAVAIDGESLVFVLDKTTQTRHMLSKIPNKQNMELVEYLPDTNPRRMRATIRVNGQIATLAYAEPAAQLPQIAAPRPAAANPAQPPTTVVNVPPNVPAAPGSPAFQKQTTQPPARHVIRRRIISGQPAAGQ
ncbi:MAG: hypothetical protein WCS31_04520 [Verrucomicrobiae bacterium]